MKYPQITILEACNLLKPCTRYSLHDPSFGDTELEWRSSNGDIVAFGYIKESFRVTFTHNQQTFLDKEAKILCEVKCAREVAISNKTKG